MSTTFDEGEFWSKYRSEFYLPEGSVYLDGNSLGLLSRRAEMSLLNTLEAWKKSGIDGWGSGENPWIDLSRRLAQFTAPLLGALPENIAVANSTTVNLHQLLATLYCPTEFRSKIVIEQSAFPTDRYAVRSHLRLHARDESHNLVVIPVGQDRLLNQNDIEASLGGDVSILLLPSVVYTTGQLLDIESILLKAHDNGIIVGLDCSHSVGAIPHELDRLSVDFAVWCGYKYLNGGPGSTAGLYLNPKHHKTQPGLAGWFGVKRESQFDMADEPEFAAGADSLMIGTPNILSLAPLLGALEMISEVGIVNIRRRSLELTGYLTELAGSILTRYGFDVVTPKEPNCRGGHVALAHPEAIKICKAMKLAGIIPDFRNPDLIRLAPIALYNTYHDIDIAVAGIEKIAVEGAYRELPAHRDLIA